MERKFKFSTGEFYHIYNRGSNKMPIFVDDKDKKRFQKMLYLCNNTKAVVYKTVQGLPLDKISREHILVGIGCYCLMDNHFHLLIKEQEDGGVTSFLEKLSTGYSMYFNKKYKRTGGLFQGTFRATHAETDEYLQYLFSYIHLNPVKMLDPEWKENGIRDMDGAKKYLADYKYSSYADYMGENREEGLILNKKSFPEYFAEFKDFHKFIDSWLTFKNEGDIISE